MAVTGELQSSLHRQGCRYQGSSHSTRCLSPCSAHLGYRHIFMCIFVRWWGKGGNRRIYAAACRDVRHRSMGNQAAASPVLPRQPVVSLLWSCFEPAVLEHSLWVQAQTTSFKAAHSLFGGMNKQQSGSSICFCLSRLYSPKIHKG